MLTNYLKTAVRSLFRHSFFSAINMLGLAVAMSICMAIIMLVADQMMYDRDNTKRDRIYRVTSRHVSTDGRELGGVDNATSPMPLKEELLNNFTGIEQVVRFKRGFGNSWLELENQDINIPLTGFFADSGALDLFEYKLKYGDPATALVEPFSVVLTQEAARKLFKEENPIGLTIKIGKTDQYTVTGVLEGATQKSHIVFEGLASMATVAVQQSRAGEEDVFANWTNFWDGWTYVLVRPEKSSDDLQTDLDKIYIDHIAGISDPETYKAKFLLQPLASITPGPLMNNAIGPSLPWVLIYFFGGLAGVILLTSCFNFTNLSIARSLTRAREIGVRKVAGAARWQIFVQFLVESVVLALSALVLAFLFLWLVKPSILQLSFARVFKWDLEVNYVVYGIFLLFAIFVGILAGIFPAAVLSGFQPVKVLKNLSNVKLFSRIGLRKVLLISQFSLSLIFILSVIVMHNQLNLFKVKDHGFDPHKNLVVHLNSTSHQQLKTELSKYNNIISISAASHIPAAGVRYGTEFKRSLDETEWTDLKYFSVDEDYTRNIGLQVIAGKFFEAGNPSSNKNFVVLNRKAVEAFHFKTPEAAIGESIIHQTDSTQKIIIGVVEDYNHTILIREIEPMALLYNPDEYKVLQVKYAGTHQQASQAVEKAWGTVNPDLKSDVRDFKAEMAVFYDTIFGDAVDILSVIAGLAIFISCLGLLGMVTYTTETRMKEISIRRILGSSNGGLVYLLSKDFLSLLLISILVAVPAAYFLNNFWLELMAYHVSIDVITILLGISFLIFFGVITICSQTWRALFVNPTENLKSD